ncbi:unnamed protein product [Lymnaea stagnalis]|uniref:Uncharacterized protein n=1 Tax=Lymnaea stagnalis TaxID=6523 RepID=A0AAV2I730_LYMST
MKNSGLLFLVIAIMHSPHEMKGVNIILDGFEPKTPNSRTCVTYFVATGQMILDDGETLDNLPPHIIVQLKCPPYAKEDRALKLGPQNGGWFLHYDVPLNRCAPPDGRVAKPKLIVFLNCWLSTGKTYRISALISYFYDVKYCSMRISLGNVTRTRFYKSIINYPEQKGLSNEVHLIDFTEAPYYNTTRDAYCDQKFMMSKRMASRNGAFEIRPPKDNRFLFCGVAMASALLFLEHNKGK